ncbi:hypothetical protein [Psychromonas sp.]|uniref:hypothetical protein n=1 Tax=Psychromonas sp. TaxID=1884585 RepID=UPI0035684027
MDRIILIAQQIAKEGKIPTTALIKARLPKNVPLPAIIQGLKMWNDNPDKEINIPADIREDGNRDKQKSIDALIDAKIAQAIAPLTKQIDMLTNQLIDLKKQLKKEEKE